MNDVAVLKIILIIYLIFDIIYAVTYTIALRSIFLKEGLNPKDGMIPFANMYKLFKIINIPFYTIFLPIVNNVILHIIPYKLLKRYKGEKKIMILSLIFPYVLIFKIGVDNRYQKPKDPRQAIKTILELESLEKKCESDHEFDDFAFGGELKIDDATNKEPFVSKTEEMIKKVEYNAISDDYFFENEVVNVELEKKNSNEIPVVQDNIVEVIEIFEQEENSLTSQSIDNIDKKLVEDDKIKRIDNAEYKEYEKEKVSDEAIAFGGTSKEENAGKSKEKDLICPRCGSSLIGSNGSCPGCGLRLSS